MNEDKLSEAERLTLELTSNPDRENLVTLIVDGDLRIIHEQDLRRVQSSFEKMDRDRSMSLSREDFRALAKINNANVERALAFFDTHLTFWVRWILTTTVKCLIKNFCAIL
jgi:hypothetical protein